MQVLRLGAYQNWGLCVRISESGGLFWRTARQLFPRDHFQAGDHANPVIDEIEILHVVKGAVHQEPTKTDEYNVGIVSQPAQIFLVHGVSLDFVKAQQTGADHCEKNDQSGKSMCRKHSKI